MISSLCDAVGQAGPGDRHPPRVALEAVGAAHEGQVVAGLELGDVVGERADPQLRARAGPGGSPPGGRRARPRRARAARSRRAPRRCRARSSAARRPCPASIMRTSTSGSREAGPIVATILVRRIGRRTVAVARRGQCCGDVDRDRGRAGRPATRRPRGRRRAARAAPPRPAGGDHRRARRARGPGVRAPRRAVGAEAGLRRAVRGLHQRQRRGRARRARPPPAAPRRPRQARRHRRAGRLYADACVTVPVGPAPRAAGSSRRRRGAGGGMPPPWRRPVRAISEAVAARRRARRGRARGARRARDRAHDPRAALGAELARSRTIRRGCTPGS